MKDRRNQNINLGFVQEESSGQVNYTDSLSGSFSIVAGPNITLSRDGTVIAITGTAGGGTDISALNAFSQSVNTLTQSLNTFTASYNIFSGGVNTFTASINALTTSLNTFTSSYNIFSGGVNTFTSSINTFSQSINSFTSSFSASVQSLSNVVALNTFSQSVNTFTASYNIFSGGVNTFTASHNIFSGAINTLTASLNTFTSSYNIFSGGVNGFTASFTASVQSIGDARYTKTVNAFSGNIIINAGPNITINSSSVNNTISISGTAAAGSTTGSYNGNFTGTFTGSYLGNYSGSATGSFTGSFNGRLSGTYLGTATNDNANAGDVGEFIKSSVAAGSAVTLANNVAANITSVSLTPGDWNVSGIIQLISTSGLTGNTYSVFCTNTTSASLATDGDAAFNLPALVNSAVNNIGAALPTVRVSLGASGNVYLIAQANLTSGAGTLKAYGSIYARRAR